MTDPYYLDAQRMNISKSAHPFDRTKLKEISAKRQQFDHDQLSCVPSLTLPYLLFPMLCPTRARSGMFIMPKNSGETT